MSSVPIHARSHRPGGPDPLPGLVHGTPASEEIQEDVDAGAAKGLNSHWYRFREAGYEYTPGHPENYRTADLGYTEFPHPLQIAAFWASDLEVVAQQPGPTSDSVAVMRDAAHINSAFNSANHWRWSGGWDDIDHGKGKQVSVTGWFKFTDWTGIYNVLNWGIEPFTSLVLNPGGTLTLTREGTDFTAPSAVQLNRWHFLAIVIGNGRIRLYVDPSAAAPADPNPTIGADFPFPGPLAMETWGLENGNYTAFELATRLANAGFATVAVQLNGTPAPGRDHADYIAKLAADVATLQAAGLTVIGWGVVDGTTAADLAATGVTGWMPQVEGPSQRTALISALGSGVGAGLPKAVVTNYGGLDTPADVAALASAGITAAAVEVYADDGHADVNVIVAAGQSYGIPIDEQMPIVGTYRHETPSDYAGLDADVVPNYGLYNVPQMSNSQWQAFAGLNGPTLEWVNPVIDEADPAVTTAATGMGFSIGESFYPSDIPDQGGALRAAFTEVFICEWMLPGDRVRAQYLAGGFGVGGAPAAESIAVGTLRAEQLLPGAEGQILKIVGGRAVWVDP